MWKLEERVQTGNEGNEENVKVVIKNENEIREDEMRERERERWKGNEGMVMRRQGVSEGEGDSERGNT